MANQSANLSPELSFLISACLGFLPNETKLAKVDGERLLALARWHSVRPHLLSSLKDRAEGWVSELRQECLDITVSNLINTQETIRIIKILEENQIPVYAYKGCAWAEWLYGNLGQREFGDIDLLVGVESFQSALSLVSQAGYSPDPYRIYLINGAPSIREAFLRTDYHIPMLRKVSKSTLEFTLEMHWQVAYPRLNFHFPSSEWSDFESFQRIQNESLRSFSNEYQFLLLLMHHGGKERWSKLKYLTDLKAYLARYGSVTDWESVMEMARSKGMIKLFKYSLGLLKGLGMEWKKDWPDVDTVPIPVKLLLEWETMPKNPENSTWAYFQHGLTMRDTFSEKLGTAISHLHYASEVNLLYHKMLWYMKRT